MTGHPFDEESVEAGAIAAWNEESIRAAGKPRSVLWSDISVQEQQKWFGISGAALSAAFKSARERGMATQGKHMALSESGAGNMDLGSAEFWRGDFPFTIIRHKGE